MATCAECVHVDVCRFYINNYAEKAGIDIPAALFEYCLNGDVCEQFKDRARFMELPVKLGEKVFYFDTAGRIYESRVTQLIYGASGFLIDSDVMFDSNLIGERFFLTREEAEQALKECESNGQSEN